MVPKSKEKKRRSLKRSYQDRGWCFVENKDNSDDEFESYEDLIPINNWYLAIGKIEIV